jgi:spermidine synthase
MRAALKILTLGLVLAGCEDASHGPFQESATKFRVERESLYNQIVVERNGEIVDLRFRRSRNAPRQTAVDLANPENLVIPYTRTMLAAALVRPEPQTILQMGLGGGALNRYVRRVFPGAVLTTAELDASVRDMAVEFMGYQPDARDVVVIEDARAFVKSRREKWDWILVDAYSGGSVPPHLKTREFYELLRARLAPGGVVALNLHLGNKLFASDQATLREVFSTVALFAVPGTGNVVALAWMGEPRDFRAADLSGFSGSLREYLAAAAGNFSGEAAAGATVLTDDFAPAEFFQQQK